MGFVVLRETYAPVLLERKAKKLRNETRNPDLRSKLASELTPSELFKLSIIRPAKMLVLSPIVLALSTFMAVAYGYLYLLFTTITNVFEGVYRFSAGTVGLTYLGIGLGSFVGLLIFGMASDRIMKAKSAAGEMKPEYRLPPMIPGAWVIPIGCRRPRTLGVDAPADESLVFIYGWTAEKHVHVSTYPRASFA